MSEFEFVYRNAEDERVVEAVDEEAARKLLAPVSRDVDEAVRIIRENPTGQMNCEGGYLRYVRR